ncbi:1,4-alpha-glucan branching enzyme GlgB [Phycisphaerae bacterium RAS1]|nr:1,4-alpha-glucan branching enzyme GlgB [Phycisphaerae bacterium RAS1]
MLVACVAPFLMVLAAADNNVEWAGLSHVGWEDRRPLCPIQQEAFDVYFQAYRFDITAARAVVTAGSTSFVNCVYDHDRGPYAIWKASIPASPTSTLRYYFEITDGSDTDYLSVSGVTDGIPGDGGWLVNFSTLEHAPYGATLVYNAAGNPAGCVFRVWSQNQTQAWVRGQFNNWGTTNPMTKIGNDFFAYVSNAADRQMYKYYFNTGAIWKTDARGRAINPGDNYNTHIENPLRHQWNDGSFQTPAFEDMICYELHVGTFSGFNDGIGAPIPGRYQDVATHVSHLVELGVNVVELMPVTEYPWDFSAGYNPVSQWAPEWKHGNPDDLKQMIDVLHQNGIAVTLDLVWNHFSNTDNFMWQYDSTATQLYFDNPAINTPWGSQADYDKVEVRDYYADSLLQWLEEFHVDGFRFDATDFINQYQPANGWGLMQRLNNSMDNRWVDKIAVAEQLPNDSWVTRPTSLGGAGFDSQWHDAFTDNLRQELIDASFGDPEMWKIGNIINGSGQYLEYTQVSNYLELHDEAWPTSGGQRFVRTIDSGNTSSVYAKGRTKLGQGVVMFSPGIPVMLQGTEWLEDINFGSGSPSGVDRIDWSKKVTYRRIFDFYRDMIHVRKTNGAFRANAGRQVYHLNEGGNVIGWQRYDGSGNVCVVIANFSNTDYMDYHIGLPQSGNWYELINSQAKGYDGNWQTNPGALSSVAEPYDGHPQSIYLTLPQMGLIVLRWNNPPDAFLDPDGDLITSANDNCPDYPNPDQADDNSDGLGNACDCNENGVYDLTDIGNGTSQDTNSNNIPDECEAGFAVGDMNCDGSIDVLDINPFILALSDPIAYAAQYPACDINNGDINDDGNVDVLDINPFVALLAGG